MMLCACFYDRKCARQSESTCGIWRPCCHNDAYGPPRCCHFGMWRVLHSVTCLQFFISLVSSVCMVLTLWFCARVSAVGAGTALLGTRAAMACTVAVEEVIAEHY